MAVTLCSYFLQLVLGIKGPLLKLGPRKPVRVCLPDSFSFKHSLDIHDTVALDSDPVLGVTKLAEDVCILHPALLGVKPDFEAWAGGARTAKARGLEHGAVVDGAMRSDVRTEGDNLPYIIPNQQSRSAKGIRMR